MYEWVGWLFDRNSFTRKIFDLCNLNPLVRSCQTRLARRLHSPCPCLPTLAIV